MVIFVSSAFAGAFAWGVWFWCCTCLFVPPYLGSPCLPVPELRVSVILLSFPAAELVFLGGSLIDSEFVFCPANCHLWLSNPALIALCFSLHDALVLPLVGDASQLSAGVPVTLPPAVSVSQGLQCCFPERFSRRSGSKRSPPWERCTSQLAFLALRSEPGAVANNLHVASSEIPLCRLSGAAGA